MTTLSERAERAAGADQIVARLEEAGRTLLALPRTGWSSRLRASRLEVIHNAAEAHNEPEGPRPAMPTAAHIARMEEAFGWLQLIPQDRYVLRRIVGARAMVSPTTGRHIYPWRKLASLLGADHKAVQRWHAEGIALIVRALTPETPDGQ